MTLRTAIFGYLFSTVGGAILLWLLVDLLGWRYLRRKSVHPKRGLLTIPLGIVERFLYTSAFIVGQPAFVAVWLGLKAAAQWKRWQDDDRDTYSLFLIGSGLSIMLAYAGAWIALGHLPLLGPPKT